MIVYGLIDPNTKELRYIGETIRPLSRRFKQHLRTAAKQTTPPVNAWMRGLVAAGQEPEVIELQRCESIEAMHEAEQFWIQYARSIGADLVNLAPGGATRVGWCHSEETRAKCRARRGERGGNYGTRWTDEMKQALAQKQRERLARDGHPHTGKKLSAEWCSNISKGRKGVKPVLSEEVKRRLDAAKRRPRRKQPA